MVPTTALTPGCHEDRFVDRLGWGRRDLNDAERRGRTYAGCRPHDGRPPWVASWSNIPAPGGPSGSRDNERRATCKTNIR